MTLNVRQVPADLIRRAKVEALNEGISLREFVIRAISRSLKKFDVMPLMAEVIRDGRQK